MGPSIPPGLRAAAIRAGAGGEQVAPQANFRHRRPLRSWHERPARKRQPPVCGRLYQSDLETTGGRGREEAGRDRVERRLRSDPEQPVLARTRPIHFFNFGMQMLQQPGKITILYDEDHAVRHVRMNQTHPAHVTPSWYGDSVGHYEGAKEAQERGAKENFRLPGAAEGWAPDPRYKGEGLQLHFTVEDEGVFTMPWSANITYRRALATEWREVVCAENTHEYYAGKDTEAPRSDKPDF